MNFSLQWFPLLPVPLIALLTGALAAALAHGTRSLGAKAVPRRSRFVLGALRATMVALFAVGLLRPVLTLPRTESIGPDVVVLVDASASMAQATRDGRSRFDEAASWLRSDPSISQASSSHRVHWFAFDRQARAVPSLAELPDVKPDGDTTDFAASLDSAIQQVKLKNTSEGRSASPARVLLMSDGLDQGARSAVEAAKEIGAAVDVWIPTSGSDSKSDLAAEVVDVQTSERVLLGSETAVQVAVRARSSAEGLALVLEEDGREVVRRELPTLAAGNETRVVIEHKPAEVGLKRYAARLARGGETIGTPRAVNVRVTDRRHDVLLLEDSWRWDFKYLKRVFEDDPHFSLTAMLSRGNGVYAHFGEPDRRVQLGGFPRSRTELDGFETLVLGNVNPQTWPRGAARHIAAAVSEGGKSLVVIAGPNLSHWLDVPELTPLLPVEITPETAQPVEGKIEVRLTPEGAASGLFGSLEGADDPSADGQSLAASRRPLPSVGQLYPAARKRPAATVLVESSTQANAYGPLPVIVEQTYGRGRVLFLATDTLWQWQTLGPRDEQGVSLYAAFWQKALRAMAPAEPTTVAASLWLRPERTAYRTRDRVRLAVELERRRTDAANAPSNTAANTVSSSTSLSATVVLPDGRRVPLDLAADARDPSRHAAWFEATAAGRYRIEAAARNEAAVVAEGATVIEVLPRSGERDPAPVDVAALARLAAATGGRVIDPRPASADSTTDESSSPASAAATGWRLPPSEPIVAVRNRSYDLWHNFTILGLLCALFAADWTLRLFRGYV